MGQIHVPTRTGTMRSSQEINNKKLRQKLRTAKLLYQKLFQSLHMLDDEFVHMFNVLSVISGFCRYVDEISVLGYYAVLSGKGIPLNAA
jgi:hypothetical protein